MKKAKTIIALSGVFVFLFSYGNISGNISCNIDNPERSDSQQTGSQTVQTQTKSTQTVSKSAQTKTKKAATGTKSSTAKSKTTPKSSAAEPVKKVREPGTLILGTQIWAEKNLNVNTFRNGDTIPEAKTNKEWVTAAEAGKPAWCYYNNDPSIGLLYGKLYNWYAVNDPRGLAPKGWTIPTDADWSKLVNFLGGQTLAGIKMKSTARWNEGNNGSNDSGFNGFPEGYRVENGSFTNIGSVGIWWSSTEVNPLSAVDRYLSQNNSLGSGTSPKKRGESVRCIKE
jgi:uncharacterized protein (TIGR02145 family)